MSVIERRHAARVLAAMDGNKVQAAKILGIHRATLARLVQEDAREEDAAAVSPFHRKE